MLLQPDLGRICIKNGFDTARLYELVYTARDPFVLGVGLAAIRDVASFFRGGQGTMRTRSCHPLGGDFRAAATLFSCSADPS